MATARRNRSNTGMTPQRQRQGSTQSCQKRKENQELNKAETQCISPLPVQLSPHVCTLKALCTTNFWKNQTISLFPLVRSLTSPPYWHMHTSRLRPKAPPETETPPEHMLCNECNAGGVSESIQGSKDISNN